MTKQLPYNPIAVWVSIETTAAATVAHNGTYDAVEQLENDGYWGVQVGWDGELEEAVSEGSSLSDCWRAQENTRRKDKVREENQVPDETENTRARKTASRAGSKNGSLGETIGRQPTNVPQWQLRVSHHLPVTPLPHLPRKATQQQLQYS